MLQVRAEKLILQVRTENMILRNPATRYFRAVQSPAEVATHSFPPVEQPAERGVDTIQQSDKAKKLFI